MVTSRDCCVWREWKLSCWVVCGVVSWLFDRCFAVMVAINTARPHYLANYLAPPLAESRIHCSVSFIVDADSSSKTAVREMTRSEDRIQPWAECVRLRIMKATAIFSTGCTVYIPNAVSQVDSAWSEDRQPCSTFIRWTGWTLSWWHSHKRCPDHSDAFDTIDHNILMTWISNCFGFMALF